MLDKLKKSEKISFFVVIILIITLVALLPILFNINYYLGIGYYSFDQEYISDYPEGRVGINIKVTLRHSGAARCDGSILVNTVSSGNIEVSGITQIDYIITVNNRFYSIEDEIINPEANVWRNTFFVEVWKDENVSCIGTAEVEYSIGGLVQNEVYTFDLSYIIPINVNDIYYTWDIPLVWILTIYIIIIFIIIYIFIRKVIHIKHVYWYTEEMKKRDTKFFKAISERKQNKKKQ